jgi:FkbM family methyltransferase
MFNDFNPIVADQSGQFVNAFFGGEPGKRYILGINEYAQAVAGLVNVDGFIDDYTDAGSWLGKPIVRLAEIDPDSMVVSCVTANRPISALSKLQGAGIRQYCDYFSLANATAGRLPLVRALSETRQDHLANEAEYQWVRARLCDDESRHVFDSLMEFRLTGNLGAMAGFEYAVDRQYFEPFVALGKGEVFVDGGGFDGYTSEEFARRCPDYMGIHLFEPSQKTLSVAKKKLAHLERVHFHALGLYDQRATLRFDADSGSASRISETGGEAIEVACLDDAVGERVTFIKLDLEGAEPEALSGSREHILTDHPKLAVAVYHHPSHFWKIPKLILGMRDDYRLYLRHYTEGWTETVMFFVPERDS